MIRILVIIMALGLGACAQVPRESVELSATVGRDIQKAHESHLALAKVLFDRMKSDVNRFVNEEYAPFQINFLFERQAQKAEAPGATPKSSMLLLISVAFSDEGTAAHREAVVSVMSKFSTAIWNDIEDYRRKLLQPIQQQEDEVFASINRHYQQLHRANSIVTGHLSSVAKVHQVQNELLESFGVDSDLRQVAGATLAKTSNQVNEVLQKVEKGEVKFDEVSEKIKKVVDKNKAKDKEE